MDFKNNKSYRKITDFQIIRRKNYYLYKNTKDNFFFYIKQIDLQKDDDRTVSVMFCKFVNSTKTDLKYVKYKNTKKYLQVDKCFLLKILEQMLILSNIC